MSNNEAKIQIELHRLEQYKTNHILHLLLTVLTAGFWLPVWGLVILSNRIERSKIRHRINKLAEEDLP